jgi:hypothetical protein
MSIFIYYLGDNCIVFENFKASIEDLIVANWVWIWRFEARKGKKVKDVYIGTLPGFNLIY